MDHSAPVGLCSVKACELQVSPENETQILQTTPLRWAAARPVRMLSRDVRVLLVQTASNGIRLSLHAQAAA